MEEQYPDRRSSLDEAADYLARDGQYEESVQWHRKPGCRSSDPLCSPDHLHRSDTEAPRRSSRSHRSSQRGNEDILNRMDHHR